MVEVMRLGHRISRDKRISTHVALVARTFGASKLYYSGQKDGEMEESVHKIVKNFGGSFKIEYVKNYLKLFKGKTVVHLTMYGGDFNKYVDKIKGDVLVVVGGEKVPGEVYELSDYNLGVGNQPHSEVAALGVFLNHLNKFKFPKFKGKMDIIPSVEGKKVFRKA
jgi:tRNA (cytidine56-2'-O)-methyltransferase